MTPETTATVIVTLASVFIGFVLAALWDTIKGDRAKQETNKLVRTLLASEIHHNVNYLQQVQAAVHREQKLQEETRQPDAGGESTEGDPQAALLEFVPTRLSQQAWQSQMQIIPSALKQQELDAIFTFYSNLNSIIWAQEDFIEYSKQPSRPHFYPHYVYRKIEEVMKSIEVALKSDPHILV